MPVVPDPLARAKARVVEQHTRLLRMAGGGLTQDEFMQRAQVSRRTVANWRRKSMIIALPRGHDDFAYPACQLTDTGLIPGLAEVLQASSLHDPWSRLGMLLTASQRLGGRSPLEMLRAGDVEAAVAVARESGSTGD